MQERIVSDADVGVSIVGNRQIHALNKKYRKKDYPTDVLSFPLNDPSQQETVPFIEAPDDILHLGDIVVSYPQAVEEAAAANTLVDEQIVFLILHGLDHLLGHHHPE